MEPCRKCNSLNPTTNQYCRSCGAVLNVPTGLVRAQRSWILPAAKRIRWKWVALGACCILGLAAVLLGGLYIVAASSVGGGIDSKVTDLAGLAQELLGVLICATALFMVAFGLGGLAVSLIARQRTVLEAVIAGIVVLALLGAVSTALAADAALVVGALALPSVALAGLGGWIGQMFDRGKAR